MSSSLVRRLAGAVVTIAVVAGLVLIAYLKWPRPVVATTAIGIPAPARTTIAAGPAPVDPQVPVPTPRIVPAAAAAGRAADPRKVASALDPLARNKALGTSRFEGLVVDPATGRTMWQTVDTDTPVQPGSTAKILTAAAVLTTLSPDDTFVTKVVQGDQDGDVILVGGGDVTLSARAAGVDTIYSGAPTVADLAAQIKAAKITVKHIYTDTTLWSTDDFADGWKSSDISSPLGGFVTRIVPLMVDGDRINPANENSNRTGTPDATAGAALARALGDPTLPVSTGGQAAAGAKVLAQVRSQPVSILLSQALNRSDNVLAEALARAVALRRGAGPSFTGVVNSITQALGDLGLKTDGLDLHDASGLSTEDKVPLKLFSDVLRLAVDGKNQNLRLMLSGLPVAGVSGTLGDRFADAGSKSAAGWVRAKTGSLDQIYAMAGYVIDRDGRVLVFVINSFGIDPRSRTAQDHLIATLQACGCS